MYKLLLIRKYLARRYIAWVSLTAVMLCTAMVLVVLSVMGGWIDMFEQSFKGLTGDVVVQSQSMLGFAHYDELGRELEALPEVAAAVPMVRTYGLVDFNAGQVFESVEVLGYPMARVGLVNDLPSALYLRHGVWQDLADGEDVGYQVRNWLAVTAGDPALSDGQRAALWAVADGEATPEQAAAVAELWAAAGGRAGEPPNRIWAASLAGQPGLTADGRAALFAAAEERPLTDAQRQTLLAMQSDASAALPMPDWFYENALPGRRGTPAAELDGMIVGTRLVANPDADGELPRGFGTWGVPTRLTVLPLETRSFDQAQVPPQVPVWIADDALTGTHLRDTNTVYLEFARAQELAEMDGGETYEDIATGEIRTTPGRASVLQLKLAEGADLQAAKAKVQAVADAVMARHEGEEFAVPLTAQTWRDVNQSFLGAVEKERALVGFLFGVISLVAIFLIFCIFYMIVVEKTRDIGILKSVGATGGGVLGVFLGYGAAIGLVGGALGLLLGALVVWNINPIHDAVAWVMGVQIWDPAVYQFEQLPNTLRPLEAAIIFVVAVVASVVGATVPAVVAAKKRPVDALRFE